MSEFIELIIFALYFHLEQVNLLFKPGAFLCSLGFEVHRDCLKCFLLNFEVVLEAVDLFICFGILELVLLPLTSYFAIFLLC